MLYRFLAVAVALFCFGCAGNPAHPGTAGPTAPSLLDFQATVREPLSPITLEGEGAIEDASDPGIDASLLDGEPSSEFSVEIEREDSEFSIPAIVTDVPGKPVNAQVTFTGLVITLTWERAPDGKAGPATGYFVYCNCTAKFAHVDATARKYSWTVKGPGEYSVFVGAQNAKGKGPTAIFKIKVPSGLAGTFTSPKFVGVGYFSRTGTTCTWQTTFSGTARIVLAHNNFGQKGTTTLTGVYSAPSPKSNCLAASGTFSGDRPLAFTAAGFSSSHTNYVATLNFQGSHANGVIKGTLTIQYLRGSGTIVIPLTLTK